VDGVNGFVAAVPSEQLVGVRTGGDGEGAEESVASSSDSTSSCGRNVTGVGGSVVEGIEGNGGTIDVGGRT
jgi:hypothetical protein